MKRFVIGTVTSIFLMGVCIGGLLPLRTHISVATAGLILIVPVIAGVVIGNAWSGAVAVLAGFFTYVVFFIQPYYTLYIGPAQNWIPLVVYVAVSLLVTKVVSTLNATREEVPGRRST